LRLKFQIRLEDAREVLLDLDDSVDFRHGAYRQSVAIVGDQVRKVFEAMVADPLLTTVNQYVRLKLDAGQASPGAVENPVTSSFPQFPSPNAIEADGRRSDGARTIAEWRPRYAAQKPGGEGWNRSPPPGTIRRSHSLA
jgi:hypothetical protein